MRKYETKEANEAFLLSLSLFNENLDAKEYIKKLYAISNQIKDNYFIFKIPKKKRRDKNNLCSELYSKIYSKTNFRKTSKRKIYF